MANWKEIETEYITKGTSYRKLADKYGLDQATIARRGKKEDWVSKRKQRYWLLTPGRRSPERRS